jgi:hypothetical protein
MPVGIIAPTCFWGIKALQVGGFSKETVKYGREFWETLTRE